MAVRSTPWPGVASVQVSLLGIYKGATDCNKFLDGKKVEYISTYFDTGKQTTTLPLIENSNNSYIGSYVLGQGFVISESTAKKLIGKDEKNKNVIMPYINGEEINSKFDQTPDRWIINFFERPLNIV